MPESAALLYMPVTLHHVFLEGQRVSQLAYRGAQQLQRKGPSRVSAPQAVTGATGMATRPSLPLAALIGAVPHDSGAGGPSCPRNVTQIPPLPKATPQG